MVHEQVLQDEVTHLVDIVVRQRRSEPKIARAISAPRREVILAANRLADVVQQRREEEHLGSRHLGREPTREWVLFGEISAHSARRRSTAATECTSTVYTW